jgi:hypothetical protein
MLFGQLLYEGLLGEQAYAEYLLADEHGVRAVVCVVAGTPQMYRLEYDDAVLGWRNECTYGLVEAMKKFQTLAETQLPTWLDRIIAQQESVGC